MKKGKEETALITWDCGSALYDSFELASVTHLLERHMVAFPALDRSSASKTEGGGTTMNIMKGSHQVGTLNKYVDQRKIVIIKSGRKENQKTSWLRNGFYRLFGSLGFLKK